MRDYKNVKVPKKYRTRATRTTVKRADTGRAAVRRKSAGASGLRSALANVLAVAVTLGCCWLAWEGYRFLTRAEIFQVSTIDVSGVKRIKDGELKEIVAVFTGQNIFRVDLDEAVRRARSDPWVKEVRIRRSLPNRIAMDVVERTPRAILDSASGRFLMDGDAVAIVHPDSSEPAWRALPVVAMKDVRVQPGEPVTADGVQEALMLLNEIEVRGGWNIADVTVKAPSPESLAVVYADVEFRIGSGRFNEKLRRLGEIMNDVQHRGLALAYVDLRPERQAAVMTRESMNMKKKASHKQQITRKRQ